MDAIVDHLWQSTIVAAAAGLLAWMFRYNSASVRYWIWFSAALKFLVPFAALTALANQVPLPQAPAAAGAALDTAALVFRSSAIPHVSSVLAMTLAAIWLAGTAAALGRAVWQWSLLASEARQAPPIVDGIIHDTLRRMERAEGIRYPTPVVDATGTREPGVVGTWKPVLMWPPHLTAGLSSAQIEAIVAHEVCHIVRRDNLLASVQIVVGALFWFHPLVWWIGARLVDERERACDERVLALGRAPVTYAESILTTCRLCIASPLVNVAGVTGGDLKRRITRIMRNEPSRALESRHRAALLVAALMLLLLPTAAGVSACRLDSDGRPSQVMSPPAPSQNADWAVNRPGGSVMSPRLIRESKPRYTERALKEKIQGEVVLECVVKPDGTVGDQKIVKSLDPDLDRAALDAAGEWLFEPGTRNGKPVNVLVTIAIAFTVK